jgi:hypothetical protein
MVVAGGEWCVVLPDASLWGDGELCQGGEEVRS